MLVSKFPTRLLIRCATCNGCAVVNRDDYAARQVFCAIDGVPMTVVSVMTGRVNGDDWPGIKRVATTTIARCGCVPSDAELAIA